MGISVESFLNIISDYKIQLLTERGTLNNTIDWFHIVETPAELNYLNKMELVFTSGDYLKTIDSFQSFVEKLIEKQCSGLVIFCYDAFNKDIQATISFCNNVPFPIMAADKNVNISNVSRLLCTQLIASERADQQLFSAMKNAISFPQKLGLYEPILMQYGFEKKAKHTVVVIKLRNVELLDTSEMQWIVKFIEQQLLVAGDKSFVLTMEDFFLLVFSGYKEQNIDEIILKIISQLFVRGYTVFTGISNNLTGLENLSKEYLQAKSAIELSVKMDKTNSLVHYGELGIYQLLLEISNQEVKQSYYERFLGKLEQYDQNNNTDYIEFLSNYLKYNCNINETAERLFIHRNTVKYKIKKISEILDCNISDMKTRIQLYIADMIRKML